MMRFIFILLMLSACSAKLTQSSITIEKDSLALRIVHHHDTVRVKGDSIKVVLKQTIHDTVIVEKQGRAELAITKRGNQTTTKCKCDSIQKALDIALVDTTRYKTKVTTIMRTIHESHVSKFDWFCRGISLALILFVIALTLRKLGIFKIPFL